MRREPQTGTPKIRHGVAISFYAAPAQGRVGRSLSLSCPDSCTASLGCGGQSGSSVSSFQADHAGMIPGKQHPQQLPSLLSPSRSLLCFILSSSVLSLAMKT